LLGEYIGRIYYDVRERPRFIIQETVAATAAISVAAAVSPAVVRVGAGKA
jgi:hypothetical protein